MGHKSLKTQFVSFVDLQRVMLHKMEVFVSLMSFLFYNSLKCIFEQAQRQESFLRKHFVLVVARIA